MVDSTGNTDVMTWVWALAIGVVVALFWTLTDRITKTRAKEELAELDTWKALPIDQRLLAHTHWSEQKVRTEADDKRNVWTFFVAVALGGTALLAWQQDLVDTTRAQADHNCRRLRTLIQGLNATVDADIRIRQEERDDIADNQGTGDARFREVPGYEQLGPGIKNFLDGLVEQARSDDFDQIATLDDELRRLRTAENLFSDLDEDLDCP